jgi:hypothetical protein
MLSTRVESVETFAIVISCGKEKKKKTHHAFDESASPEQGDVTQYDYKFRMASHKASSQTGTCNPE